MISEALLPTVALLLTLGTPAEDGKSKAKQLLDEGNALLANGQFESALERYQAAHAAFPSPKIRLNIAETHRQLGRYAASLAEYERFVTESDPTKDAALQAGAKDRIGELSGLVGRLTVTGVPPGATVRLDGATHEGAIAGLVVDPGRHEVRVTAEAYAELRESVLVKAGQSAELKVSMTPLVVEAPPPPPPPSSGPAIYDRWWFWAAIGAVVVTGVGVGVGVGLSGSEPFVPSAELGSTKISTW